MVPTTRGTGPTVKGPKRTDDVGEAGFIAGSIAKGRGIAKDVTISYSTSQ